VARAWYVIHTYSGHENKVKANIEQRIQAMNMTDKVFEVIVPTCEVLDLRKKSRENKKKLFPGYVLVEMELDDDSWHVVRNTPGVTGFVGFGNKPTPLSEKEAHNIFKQMGLTDEKPKLEINFEVGQRVKIIDGPFSENYGIIEAIDQEKRKVKVSLVVFNRETSVEFNFMQIEEA